ncbi:DUF4176 domain-containing protein [Pseudolactococcus reticulitermitis]|uniref:DUF4176 domain-containing protein n=1 Tax=Pseudolactococcus reticulitermitis TaxID=2025039 RepID=A0A224X337_9LACT|nr:DUF4176 domain-containing protein [Lactococcus reticulitermitis]GAX48467.1 hypothetical protein RsY01_2096 [Lactococcus reticulitermitis]
MSDNNILPIGTILYLKEGTQKLMILNRGSVIEISGESVLFDYSAAIYPVGLNPEQVLYFNKEDIDEIVFEGYNDDEEKRFVQLYEEWEKNEGSKLKKGNVSETS